jgi:CheY-like chemotaxis protein
MSADIVPALVIAEPCLSVAVLTLLPHRRWQQQLQLEDDGVRNLLLLVEDELDIREPLHELLEYEGFDVVATENGQQALCALEYGLNPDVVITDLNMPVMNGWQLLARMRQSTRWAALPVMVASAAVDPMALPRGVCIVRKPFVIATFLAAVWARASPCQKTCPTLK